MKGINSKFIVLATLVLVLFSVNYFTNQPVDTKNWKTYSSNWKWTSKDKSIDGKLIFPFTIKYPQGSTVSDREGEAAIVRVIYPQNDRDALVLYFDPSYDCNSKKCTDIPGAKCAKYIEQPIAINGYKAVISRLVDETPPYSYSININNGKMCASIFSWNSNAKYRNVRHAIIQSFKFRE